MERSLGHVRGLDGLRGLLFLVVLSAHLEPWPGMVGGQVAMATFFALSGFLITSVLLDEDGHTGAVSLGRFYGRRALRLLPALVVFLLAWLAVVVVFGSRAWMTTVPGGGPGGPVSLGTALKGIGVATAYLTNWWQVFHLFTAYLPLGHLWSLAVEEQFYVLWAPVLAVLLGRSRRATLPATLLLAGASLVLSLFLWHGGSGAGRIYDGTDTRAAALLLGCAGAMVWRRGWLERIPPRLVSGLTAGAVTALLLSGFGMNNPASSWQWLGGWAADSVASAVLVAMVVTAPRGLTARILSNRVVVYVGRRSYALYLWHYAYATWFNGLNVVGYPLTIAASFATAEVSWRLVERPALSLKSRLAPVSGAAPVSGTVGAGALAPAA